MAGNLIRIDQKDNVAVSLTTLVKGDVVNIQSEVITILTEVPAGHKVSVKDIRKGEDIIKYGLPVGKAMVDIPKGSALHIFNIKEDEIHSQPYVYDSDDALSSIMALEERRQNYGPASIPMISAYRRKNGETGIRNELWFLSLSPDAAETAENLTAWANGALGIHGGCDLWKRLEGGSADMAENVLANIAMNPNAGAVIVIAEDKGHLDLFKKRIADGDDSERYAYHTISETEEIKKDARAFAERIKKEKRQSLPMSSLRIGVKCSGSDGLSGITANPLAGSVIDEIIAMGGSAIFTETAEMFGAERLLLERCTSKKTFDDMVTMLESYKDHVRSIGRDPYEKLTMENRRGGLTTITERSLGSLQKGGSSPVESVLSYNERISKPGLSVIPGPSGDMISLQLQSAAGCQLILFTTGDGEIPSVPTPLVAISTHQVTERNREFIDFNAGVLLKEERQKVTERLMADIIEIASGEKSTRTEKVRRG